MTTGDGQPTRDSAHTLKTVFVMLLAAATLSSCGFSQQTHFVRTDRPVGDRESFFVVIHPGDSWHIGRMIGDRLRRDGFEVAEGETPPAEAQVLVTYEDRWVWDITMYMLSLKVEFRDAATNQLLASSQSFRTSLRRRTPPTIVDEVLGSVFLEEAR